MNNLELVELLNNLGACKEAVDWLEDRDFAAAWQECERADWLIWLAWNMADKKGWPSPREIALVIIACGRLTLDCTCKYQKQLAEIFDVSERCLLDSSPENRAATESAAELALSIAERSLSAERDAQSIAEGAAYFADAVASATVTDLAADAIIFFVNPVIQSAAPEITSKMCVIIRDRLKIPATF